MTKREKQDRSIMFQKLMAKGLTLEECQKLRRISLTLQRWYDLECGTENRYGDDVSVARGFMRGDEFVQCENESECQEFGATCKPYIRIRGNKGFDPPRYYLTSDRERGALKRLAAIMAPYKRKLTYYIQTDPRGHALYIIPLTNLRKLGKTVEDIDSCYNSVGIEVY